MQRSLRRALNCIAIFIVSIMMFSACMPAHVHIDWTDVSTQNYKPEDGMAVFLPIGTEFFEIKDYDNTQYIAVLEDDLYILYKALESESVNFE